MTEDVVIAGGGPNGLMLAAELCLAGVKPVVLERMPARNDDQRPGGMVGRVIELLDRRGLYERLSHRTQPAPPSPFYQFGGLLLDLRTVPGNPLRTLAIAQRRLEEVLEERARGLGADIRRGHEVTAVRQDVDAVTINVCDPGGGHRLRARYLVGADGRHSAVRRGAGIDFPGMTDDGFVGRSGHVMIPDEVFGAHGDLRLPGVEPIRPLVFHRTDDGVFVFASFRPGIFLVNVMEWDRPVADPAMPMTVDELRNSVRRVLGADLPMTAAPPGSAGPAGQTGPPTEPPAPPATGPVGGGVRVAGPPRPRGALAAPQPMLRRMAGISSRQAARYRAGRILLLGDAAHVHSAVGGPGLNLGLQDAANLGWKLAAAVRGWAPSWLLDSYHEERHPVGRRVIMHTRAQMALLRPGCNVSALRELMSELLDHSGAARQVADLLAGADVHYSTCSGGGPAHPMAGRWAPDLKLSTPDGPRRLAELLRGARPVLLELSEPGTPPPSETALAEVAAPWAARVDRVAASAESPLSALLIRPDGYLAWAAGRAEPADEVCDGLAAALGSWFGRPPSA